MRGLQEAEVLRLLDRGRGLGPVERGLLLLEHAWPEADAETRGALPIGERDRRFMALRVRTFGRRASLRAACHECGTELEAELDLESLLETGSGQLEPSEEPRFFAGTFDHDGRAYRFRPPNSGDLLAVARAGSAAGPRLLARCVEPVERGSPEGDPDPPTSDPGFSSAFSAAVTTADPLADVELDFACSECGHAFAEVFDAVDFFWAEIEAYAERLLREIHLLARAYGWTEGEIIALGSARRRRYFGIVTHG